MRGKRAKKRKPQKDHRYGSVLITKLVNKVLQGGKKELAEKIVYGAIEEGAKKFKVEPDVFLETAMANVRPALEVRARRVGGANYQVPMPVTPARQDTLAIRWVVGNARSKGGKDFKTLLLNELVNAYKGEGDAVKKKEEVEKMAEANKAFAHFRW